MLERARKKAKKRSIGNIVFEHADICNLSYADDSFDIVIASQVLHLLDEPKRAADETMRVARGKIILPLCIVQDASGFAKAQIGLWKLLGFSPKHSFDRQSYLAFLKNLGFWIDDWIVIESNMPMIIAICSK